MTTPPEPPQGDAWQDAPRMSPEQNQPGYGAPPPPAGPPGYGGGGYGGPPGYGGGNPIHQKQGNGMAVAALVLGIIALLSGWMLIGSVFGLLAIIFGFLGRGRAKRGASGGTMALLGIIFGVLGILSTVLVVTLLAPYFDDIGNYAECVEQAQGDAAEEAECDQRFRDDVNR